MVIQCFTMSSPRLHGKIERTIAIDLFFSIPSSPCCKDSASVHVLFVALTQAIYADFQNKTSTYIKNTENAKQNVEFYH